ncbi:hypothetical protein Mal48_37990 [Thalassoglobus polymorphus]|uniref:Uncharacterized protein n=1 Tax=Thalassoglobus polymorphus TaxID=2527994 RepID=A0A517QSG1_9PLAN|nr:hypothetical protein Mal48_37990 [Thalassoglobus polymorphus]
MMVKHVRQGHTIKQTAIERIRVLSVRGECIVFEHSDMSTRQRDAAMNFKKTQAFESLSA